MTFDRWIEAVDRHMRRDWCIDSADAGLSQEELRRFWSDGETPAEFVTWFAEKYDLIKFEPRPRRWLQPSP